VKIFFYLILFVIIAFGADDELDIEIQEETENKSLANKFQKVFSGNLNSSLLHGDTGYIQNYNIIWRYEDSFFNFLKIKLESKTNKTRYKITYENSDKYGSESNPEIDVPAREFDTFSLRDSYLDINVGEFASIIIGKKVIIWGQLELFSPIDIVMPTKSIPTVSNTSKIDNRLSQEVLFLNIYPIESLELQLYYFPNITRDIISRNNLDDLRLMKFARPWLTLEKPEASKEFQTAGRLVYYGDSFTFGLTHYKGWEKQFTSFYEVGFDSAFAGGVYRTSTEAHKIQQFNMLGAELAIPIGNFNIKLEASTFKKYKNLAPEWYGFVDKANANGYANNDEVFSLAEWSVSQNESKLYIPITTTIIGAGVDYNSQDWIVNLSVLYSYNEYENSKDKEGDRLSKEAYGDNINIAPLGNIARKFGTNRSYKIGLLGGYAGNTKIISAYLDGTFYESLNMSISYGEVKQDNSISTPIGYEAKALKGTTFKLGYKF
jgi:hypothetical protein